MNNQDFADALQDMDRKYDELLSAVKSPPPVEQKDFWDKFQSMSTFLSGVIIALVGLIFTSLYNERQAQRDQAVKEQQIRLAQVELMQKFLPQLTGPEQDKRLALVAISALGNTELATSLAGLDRSEGSRQALESIAVGGKTEAERQTAKKTLENFKQFGHILSGAVTSPGASAAGKAALAAAEAEIKSGAFERGPNQGSPVEKYLTVANVHPGQPWSAAFVSWCFLQAPRGSPFTPSGSWQQLYREFGEKGWIHLAGAGYVPAPGDVLFLLSTNGRDTGDARPRHGGIVLKAEGNTVYAVEGNTNVDGTAEGVMVAIRPRKLSVGMAFGHVPDVVAE